MPAPERESSARLQRICRHLTAAFENPPLVTVGRHQLPLDTDGDDGGSLGLMEDQFQLLNDDPAAARAKLQSDGFLLLKGVLNREQVLEAGEAISEKAVEMGYDFANWKPDKTLHPPFFGHSNWRFHPRMGPLLQGPELQQLFDRLFDEPAVTLDYKWVRATPPGGFTAFHMVSEHFKAHILNVLAQKPAT